MPVRKRKKSKAGRPRKEGVREANGRLSRRAEHVEIRRAESEQQIMSVAIDQRVKAWGITPEKARSQAAETAIGALMLMGQEAGGINRDQYLAAQQYLDDRNAYQRAVCSKPDYSERRLPGDGDENGYEAFCKTAVTRWESLRSLVRETMIEKNSPAGASFLSEVVIANRLVWELVPDGRDILNALVRFYAQGKRKAA